MASCALQDSATSTILASREQDVHSRKGGTRTMQPCRMCGNTDFESNGICRVCGTAAPRDAVVTSNPPTAPEPTPTMARRGSRPLHELDADPGATNPSAGHFCGRCGSTVEAGADFCGICGNPLNAQAFERVSEQRQHEMAATPDFLSGQDLKPVFVNAPGVPLDLASAFPGGDTQPQTALALSRFVTLIFVAGLLLMSFAMVLLFLRH